MRRDHHPSPVLDQSQRPTISRNGSQPHRQVGSSAHAHLAPGASTAPRRRSSQQGVTLIELVSSLAILTILLTLGVGNMARLIAENRVVKATNGLVGMLQYARAEAVFRGTDVAVCAVDPQGLPTSGDPCRTDDDDWAEGYAAYVRDSGEVLRLQGPEPGVHIDVNRPRFIFRPNGSASGTNGRASVCDARAKDGADRHAIRPRAVVLSPVGRVRVGDQVSGAPVVCGSSS